ncbi:PREDICTED: uncharacterized protein LOC105366657 isoform X1 [Ceratosolen solmsi marchali]|uniref:Uncharacterized protein LOC105366657 isoform X1 n=1 Tax=Ceratosolen solmsi marchali TaxID=326594 RepID=A0AAJ7E0T1_9HYME|nr:PREDICTED: uncharacterized protein LOC105366657 isoform X1 [Ceratosolen solmsi marchali]
MRWIMYILGLFFMAMRGGFVQGQHKQQENEEEGGILNCLFKSNYVTCMKKRMAWEIDRIEMQITGRASQIPMSKIIEESGSLLANGMHTIFRPKKDDIKTLKTYKNANSEIESRKKKLGKKKKKHLQKLLLIVMLLKSKISLLLQLLSTHFQVKFFLIAILSLLMNAARFWLDIKKGHRPSKVIYYEHAQHQHHYDHDDDHGIWGRSSDEIPQELAYSAYAPEL